MFPRLLWLTLLHISGLYLMYCRLGLPSPLTSALMVGGVILMAGYAIQAWNLSRYRRCRQAAAAAAAGVVGCGAVKGAEELLVQQDKHQHHLQDKHQHLQQDKHQHHQHVEYGGGALLRDRMNVTQGHEGQAHQQPLAGPGGCGDDGGGGGGKGHEAGAGPTGLPDGLSPSLRAAMVAAEKRVAASLVEQRGSGRRYKPRMRWSQVCGCVMCNA